MILVAQITGWINVATGLMGGHIGSHSPGLVSMNKEAGTTTRAPGVAQVDYTTSHHTYHVAPCMFC